MLSRTVQNRPSARSISNGYQLSAATGLHQGDRQQQQDQVILLAHPYITGCVMGVVADGMGGLAGGRKASDQVIRTAEQLFDRYQPETDHPAELLHQIAKQADTLIKLTAITTEQQPHSTLATFLITPDGTCWCAHSGDSRICYFHGKMLLKRTHDHSYVQTLVDQGQLTEEEAAVHPQSNVLTSCLGMKPEPKLDIFRIRQLNIGDTLLACSDGLWHYFTTQELGWVVSSLPPRDASQLLIHKARERAMGYGDNLSLVIVRIDRLKPEKKAAASQLASLN